MGSEPDLVSVLQRIVETAVDLVGARFGALGVLNESQTGLAAFITVGIDDETHRAIGDLPKGLGLLGALITDARPLRIPDLREDPGRSGLPPNHPTMTSFFGVPIRVRQEVFGNLSSGPSMPANCRWPARSRPRRQSPCLPTKVSKWPQWLPVGSAIRCAMCHG